MLPFESLYVVAVWLLASGLCARLAHDKGRNAGWWLLLALFASPVVGLLGLAAASDLSARKPPQKVTADSLRVP
jgi:uncharacterized membrane protein YhaH (DUF805 family)